MEEKKGNKLGMDSPFSGKSLKYLGQNTAKYALFTCFRPKYAKWRGAHSLRNFMNRIIAYILKLSLFSSTHNYAVA